MSDAARRGFELFRGKADYVACHSIGEKHALFTDQRLHNTGIGYQRAAGDQHAIHRILVAPGTFLEVERSVIEALGEQPAGDLGLYEVTLDPADRWKYKTPTLLKIALTARTCTMARWRRCRKWWTSITRAEPRMTTCHRC